MEEVGETSIVAYSKVFFQPCVTSLGFTISPILINKRAMRNNSLLHEDRSGT